MLATHSLHLSRQKKSIVTLPFSSDIRNGAPSMSEKKKSVASFPVAGAVSRRPALLFSFPSPEERKRAGNKRRRSVFLMAIMIPERPLLWNGEFLLFEKAVFMC